MNKKIIEIICDFYECWLNNMGDATGFYSDAEFYFNKLYNADIKLQNKMNENDKDE